MNIFLIYIIKIFICSSGLLLDHHLLESSYEEGAMGAEMPMLKWMCGTHYMLFSSMNILSNYGMRIFECWSCSLADIEGDRKENRLQWFGLVRCHLEDAPVKVVEGWDMGEFRSRGRRAYYLTQVSFSLGWAVWGTRNR